ncbi:MAG: type II secretion system protein GspG [Kofleriaceae bacterium]
MKTILLLAIIGCSKTNAPAPANDPALLTKAKATVQQLAFEAFPEWSVAHADKACPAKLDELFEYSKDKTGKDPWGHDYKMFCGANLPAGAKGLAVMSAGPDGKDGTDDDISSWK